MAFKIGLDEKVTRGVMTHVRNSCLKYKLIIYIDWREKDRARKMKNRKKSVSLNRRNSIFFHFQSFAIDSSLTGFLCSWALWTRGSALYQFIFTEDGLEHRSSIEIITKGNVYSIFMF